MSFKEAIEQTPLLKDHFQPGLKALGSNSNKVKPADTQKCEGSVDIDTAVKPIYPNAARWDYAIAYNGITHFIEVHPADTREIKAVLNKLEWLKIFLINDASELNKKRKYFHWIASKSNHILPTSSQFRKLSQSGLTITKELILK